MESGYPIILFVNLKKIQTDKPVTFPETRFGIMVKLINKDTSKIQIHSLRNAYLYFTFKLKVENLGYVKFKHCISAQPDIGVRNREGKIQIYCNTSGGLQTCHSKKVMLECRLIKHSNAKMPLN